MNTQLKRKIDFSLSMGVVTTEIISFVLLALNLGFSERIGPRMVAFLGYWVRYCHSRDLDRPPLVSASRSSR